MCTREQLAGLMDGVTLRRVSQVIRSFREHDLVREDESLLMLEASAAANRESSAPSWAHRLGWRPCSPACFLATSANAQPVAGRLKVIAALTDPASIRTPGAIHSIRFGQLGTGIGSAQTVFETGFLRSAHGI